MRDLCSDPLRDKVHGMLPADAPFCSAGVSNMFVRLEQGGHEVFVVAYRDESPSWADGPVLYGDYVVFDGVAGQPWGMGDKPFWLRLGDLSGLSADQAQVLLQAVLLETGSFVQLATPDEARLALAAWGDALALVESQPPGLYGDEGGWLLRLWSSGRQAERGVQCSHLSRLEIGLTADGTVSEMREESWAEGTMLGGPCGTPLPVP